MMHRRTAKPRIVTGTRLDTFTKANALVKPYLVKIDVDGNEMKILSGATETLKDASIVIIETPKGEFSEHIAFLEKQGFVLFDLVAPCYYDDSFWQCDSIFIRSELQRRHFKQLEQRFDPTAYVEFNEASLAVPDTTPAPSLDRSDGVVTNFFIVIPTKDSAEYLDQSLGSILLQAGDFELHVPCSRRCLNRSNVERCRSLAELAVGNGQEKYHADVRQPAGWRSLRRHHSGVRNYSTFRRHSHDLVGLGRCLDARRLGNGEVGND